MSEEVKEEVVLGALPKPMIESMIKKLYEENKEVFDTMTALQQGLQLEVKPSPVQKEEKEPKEVSEAE